MSRPRQAAVSAALVALLGTTGVAACSAELAAGDNPSGGSTTDRNLGLTRSPSSGCRSAQPGRGPRLPEGVRPHVPQRHGRGRSPRATAGRGATLSAAYCLGLGIPFVLVAVAMRAGLDAVAVVRRHGRAVMIIGGVLLIATGVLQVTGEWNSLVIQLRSSLPGFSETPV